MGWPECCPASNGLVEAGVKVRYPLQDLEGRGHRLGVFWMEEEVASVQFPSVVLFFFVFFVALRSQGQGRSGPG